MTIAIDARMIGWTGIGTYTRRLLEHLQAVDQTNQYLVLLRGADYDQFCLTAANFRKVRADFRPFSLTEQIGFAAYLYRLRPDLVHFLNFNGPCLYLRRRMFTIHDLTLVHFKNVRGGGLAKLLYEVKYWVMRFVLRCSVQRSVALITPSQYVKDDIVRHWRQDAFPINPAKITVTYEGVDSLPDAPTTARPLKDPYLLYVGNAYPHKNLGGLVEAFSRLINEFPGLQLVLVGREDYFQRQVRQKVRALGLDGKVIFPGYVPNDDLAAYYQYAEAYVFPSLSEGFGLPPLGAMQAGTPVISSDRTCLPEVLGEAAIYFDPTNAQDMADVIEGVLDSPDELARLRVAGSKQAAKYSWRCMAEETLEVYKKLT